MYVQQVRDLLKGTLAFRGSTMETECDFMEIDNNIASRLQIPSLDQQKEKDTELPEGLPVPMLANFGHFENSDEYESSFMSGDGGEEPRSGSGSDEQAKENDECSLRATDEQAKENGECSLTATDEQAKENGESSLTATDEQAKENGECSLTATETSKNAQKQIAEELENLNIEITSVKQENNGEFPNQNIAVHEGAVKDDNEDLFASFGEGPGNLESIISNPLFCGEIQDNNVEDRTHVDNSTAATPFGSNVEYSIDSKTGQLDNQQPVLLSHKGSAVGPSETDPLFNPPEAKAANPLNERQNPNDSSEKLSGAESLDRDFVFVNRDGTAQGESRPPRHPLENSDEF